MLSLKKKGHWSKQCPNKLQHLIEIIDALKFCDNEYKWTTSTQDVILVDYENMKKMKAWIHLQKKKKIRY